MTMDANTKRALFNALTWMESMKHHSDVDNENVEVGIQCLTEAFGINLSDVEQKDLYALDSSVSFEEVFRAGMNALGLEAKVAAPGTSSVDEDPVVQKNPDLWKKWVAKLEDKGFFNGTTAGSDEHNARLQKALGKFKEKFGDVKPAAAAAAPSMTTEEKQAKAEELKAQGNAALNGGDHKKAAELYKEALKLSPEGPSSHIYHSNLAAALMYLHKYTEVIDHCESSIALKPSYVKAYSRMGQAQLHLKDLDGAIDSFRRGLEVDSTNSACKDGLADAERKLRQSQAATTRPAAGGAGAGAGAGGMPDLSGLASMLGGAGGAGGLAGLMNNPAMQQMAAQMMQNPAMMQMAQNMMQNPEMMSNMMGSLGGMGGAGGASAGAGAGAGGMPGMPDPAAMADAFRNSPEVAAARSDPDLQDFFRDVETQGPSAAMRHMSNPKVSQLLQSVMSRLS